MGISYNFEYLDEIYDVHGDDKFPKLSQGEKNLVDQ